jgi:hypothetical protein
LNFDDDSVYIEQIETIRKEKVNFLTFNPESPIKGGMEFTAFKFYDISSKYKVKAELKEIGDIGRIQMPTNDGTMRDYIKFSKAVFTIDGKTDSLSIYIEPTFNAQYKMAFVPFMDETNDMGSYGGGRYLDVEIKDEKYVILDFNLAYNPYCAYDESFICPLPPLENKINFRIEAGEKKYDSLH